MAAFAFTIPGPPVPLARARATLGGHHYTPGPSRKYQSAGGVLAQVAMIRANWPLGGRGPFRLSVRVYRACDRGDLDNFVKMSADLLTKVKAWSDDARVRELSAWMGIDKRSPRMEIRVETIAEYGTTLEWTP